MTNIVLNPDFELGLANWTSSDTSEYAIDNTEFYNGTASLKLTTTNGLASSRSTKFTVLPTPPAAFTEPEKAPAKRKIRAIIIIFS